MNFIQFFQHYQDHIFYILLKYYQEVVFHLMLYELELIYHHENIMMSVSYFLLGLELIEIIIKYVLKLI
jgi:hypothetical protein